MHTFKDYVQDSPEVAAAMMLAGNKICNII